MNREEANDLLSILWDQLRAYTWSDDQAMCLWCNRVIATEWLVIKGFDSKPRQADRLHLPRTRRFIRHFTEEHADRWALEMLTRTGA